MDKMVMRLRKIADSAVQEILILRETEAALREIHREDQVEIERLRAALVRYRGITCNGIDYASKALRPALSADEGKK